MFNTLLKGPAQTVRYLRSASACLLIGTMLQLPAYSAEGVAGGRVDYARHMIIESSAAQKVESAQVEAALQHWEKAKSLLAQAELETDKERCDELIDQALNEMFAAVRLSKPEETLASKLNKDFDNKYKSVEALLEAMQHISEEKAEDAKALENLQSEVNTALALATEQKQSDVRLGISTLEDTLITLKTRIQELREGETLVRSLNFASKEEEYHYEIDRNDTHQMLVTVLLAEKIESSQSIKERVDTYMSKARDLREQAERAADAKDWELGIDLLEQSTKEIVRAIRGAGIYIPG